MDNQKNIPELRFPEFEGNWESKKFKEIGDFFSGGTPLTTKTQYFDGEIPFIRSGEISSNFTEQFITEDGLRNSSSKMVRTGDILYALYGATSGEVAISKINGAINQAVLCIRSLHDHYYLYSYLLLKKATIIKTFLQGGQGNLSAVIIKNLTIPYPSFPEQQKIASFFTAIDQKISQLKQKKTLLEQYKKGVMQLIFTQEIRFRDDNKQVFPKWEKKRLGEVAKFSKGKGISKSEVSISGTTECIRYGELYTFYSETIDEVKSKTITDSQELVLSQANDIIIPASGETQIDIATASCVLRSGIVLGGDLNIIRSANNGVFLSYYLNNHKKNDIAKLAQGISVVHLYSSQLSSLEIEIPSVFEQTKIANFLSSIDVKINHTQTQIEKAELWKKGLLQKMFV